MTSPDSARIQGVEGGGPPSRAGTEDTSASAVSDGPSARLQQYPSTSTPSDGTASKAGGRGGRLDVRFGESTLKAVRARADRLSLRPSTWVKSVVRDALDRRRTEAFDAALGAALVVIEARVQASADARVLADQIRPLAININDLDHRARASQLVHVDNALLTELVVLLREVRGLLGDRLAA